MQDLLPQRYSALDVLRSEEAHLESALTAYEEAVFNLAQQLENRRGRATGWFDD